MSKKLFAACLVIAAFAVIPSLAAAKPVITHPTGTVLATGTKLTATNIGNTKMTLEGLPTLECSTAILTGELTKNNSAEGIEGNITSAKFGGDSPSTIPGDEEPECTGGAGNSGVTTGITNGLPWCLRAVEANDTFTLRGGLCSAATRKIVFQLTTTSFIGTITCRYERASLSGTFTTDTTGDAIGTLSEVSFTRTADSSEFCPSAGKLDMSFTLETDVSPASQVWIS